jgi:bacillithiol synthase
VKFISHTIAGSPLVQGALQGEPEALRFYPGGDPRAGASYDAVARRVDARFGAPERERLATILRGGGTEGEARLERFVREGGLAVTTGQQPGLFGGPLYSVYKALTAVALARALEGRTGRVVIPVFWIASEDHDWDEVRGVSLPDLENELVELALETREEDRDAPLHRVRLGGELDRLRERLLTLLPPSDFRPEVERALEGAYHEGATLPGAFAELLLTQLGAQAPFVLSPEHPAAQEAALPVLLHEARSASAREEALRTRAAELEAAGFPVQVPILDGGVNLFLEGSEGRDRLFLEPGAPGGEGTPTCFRLRRSGRILTGEELEEAATRDPAALSPHVLLRPVVESALVPTLAYVAGPGEFAYYAQTAPVFEGHGIAQPVIHPRLSGTVVETKVGKVLEKFGLAREELARPHHEVAGRLLRDEIPEPVRRALGTLRGTLSKGAAELRKAVGEVDPTLSGPVDHLRSQGFALVDDVERKVVQALRREQAIALQQLEKAQLHLYPRGRPQERVFPAVYYLARYGSRVLEGWRDGAEEAVLPR